MPRARTQLPVGATDPPMGVRVADDRRHRTSADEVPSRDHAGARMAVRPRPGSAARSARVRRRVADAGRTRRAGPTAEGRGPGAGRRSDVHRRRRAVGPARPVAGHPRHVRAARMVVPRDVVADRRRAAPRSRRPVDRRRAHLARPGTRRAARCPRGRRELPALLRRSRTRGAAAPRRRPAGDLRHRGRGRSHPGLARLPAAGRPGRMGDRPGARIREGRRARRGLPVVARRRPGRPRASVGQPRLGSSWRRQR